MAEGTKLPVESAIPTLDFVIGGEELGLYPAAFQKMCLYETITQGTTFAYFRFYDRTAELLERVVRQAKDSFRFRYGWSEGFTSDWKEMSLNVYDLTWHSQGWMLDMWVTDKGGDDTVVNTRAFREMSVSDMVEQIASEMGIESKIEPTTGILTLRQNNITDTNFIEKWLKPRALSSRTGRGDYRFYFENGDTLHFHPPDYKAPDYKTYDVTKGEEHPILKFRFRSNIDYVEDHGGLELRVEGYDPINKRLISVDVNDDSTPEKAALGLKLPEFDTGSGLGSFIAIPFKDDTAVLNYAKQHWYANNIKLHPAYMKMRTDPLMMPGRSLKVVLEPLGTGIQVQGSGRYLVETLITTLSARARGNYQQHVLMTRNAFKEQAKNIVAVDTQPNRAFDINTEEGSLTLFGRKINLKEILPEG